MQFSDLENHGYKGFATYFHRGKSQWLELRLTLVHLILPTIMQKPVPRCYSYLVSLHGPTPDYPRLQVRIRIANTEKPTSHYNNQKCYPNPINYLQSPKIASWHPHACTGVCCALLIFRLKCL